MSQDKNIGIIYCITTPERKKYVLLAEAYYGITIEIVESSKEGKVSSFDIKDHLNVLQKFGETEHNVAMVLEDNFEFHEDWLNLLDDAVGKWDISQYGILLLSSYIKSSDIYIKDTMHTAIPGISGYLITKDYAKECLTSNKNSDYHVSTFIVGTRAIPAPVPIVMDSDSVKFYKGKSKYTRQLISEMLLS